MLDPVRAKARIIGVTAAAFLGGLLFASGLELTAGSYAGTLLQAPDDAEIRPVAELSHAFISISEAVTPAVVNISSEMPARRDQQQHPEIPQEFRDLFPGLPDGGQQGPQVGTGTGFLITNDGYIMTNNHVVEGAERIEVTMLDGRKFNASIVGRDAFTDIAVIRIEGSGFPTARLGRSEASRVGEWVLAIGNPLGLDHTVTAGIISAKGRGLNILAQELQRRGLPNYAIEDFIQTDAAINRGNSGGPLVNLRGEVIGVNTAILGNAMGGGLGYGFAVPIDLARRVADNLIRHGEVRRAALGVQIDQVDAEAAEVAGLPEIAGVLIQDFTEDSPAQRAGIQPGDVIVGVEGQPIRRTAELQREVALREPGETVTVDVIRNGERRQVRVRLGEAQTQPQRTAQAPTEDRAGETLGISEVRELTPEVARRLGFRSAEGVIITRVVPNSVAHRRGLIASPQAPLRVVSVQGQPVRTVDEFNRAIRSVGAGEVLSIRLEAPDGQAFTRNMRVPG
jgi:serine protease Do